MRRQPPLSSGENDAIVWITSNVAGDDQVARLVRLTNDLCGFAAIRKLVSPGGKLVGGPSASSER